MPALPRSVRAVILLTKRQNAVWTYSLGPFLSILPTRWRDEHLWRFQIRWSRAALVSGLLEAAISAPLAWVSPSRVITSLAAYFAAEGIVRFYAAISTHEAVGSFPLIAAADIYRIVKSSRARPKLPLVRDEISSGNETCDLKIASCRPKTDWKYPFTVRYAGAYFQVVEYVDVGAGSRPYIYSLRRLPPGEIAGGLKDYDPEDILAAIQPLERIES